MTSNTLAISSKEVNGISLLMIKHVEDVPAIHVRFLFAFKTRAIHSEGSSLMIIYWELSPFKSDPDGMVY